MIREKSRNLKFPLDRPVLRDTRKNNVKVFWKNIFFTLKLRENPYRIFPLGSFM